MSLDSNPFFTESTISSGSNPPNDNIQQTYVAVIEFYQKASAVEGRKHMHSNPTFESRRPRCGHCQSPDIRSKLTRTPADEPN